jgi:hypothetical protein
LNIKILVSKDAFHSNSNLRHYSEYTLGGDMDDLNGERSMPSTPAVLAGAFGDVGGVDGFNLGGLATPGGMADGENTPAGWSNMATVASPRSAGYGWIHTTFHHAILQSPLFTTLFPPRYWWQPVPSM